MSERTDQSTRLLCASALFNHGKARNTLREWSEDPNRAVVPEPGLDLKLALQVARFSEKRERFYWRMTFLLSIFVIPAVLATQDTASDPTPVANAIIAGGVVAAALLWAYK